MMATQMVAEDAPPQAFTRDATLSYNTFGSSGLIDMPTAQTALEGDFAATYAHFGGTSRTTLSFQILPRLSGSFRYSKIDPYSAGGGALYDRSFDLRYLLLEEGGWSPAVALGVQDFIGTSVYSGEYVVATKHITPDLAFTGGIGWGRLASYGTFQNPLSALSSSFDERETGKIGEQGGRIDPSRWFKGDAALFGGLAWRLNDKLLFKAEYSSDDFDREQSSGANDWESPFNFGIDYQLTRDMTLQGYYLHGAEIGFGVSLVLNPKDPVVYGGAEAAPLPVYRRRSGAARDTSWYVDGESSSNAFVNAREQLASDGLEIEAAALTADSATVYLRNNRYGAPAEAIGRTARVLTRTLPASVETFRLIPVENGQPQAMVTLNRSDLENLEFAPNGTELSYARAQIDEAPLTLPDTGEDLYPRFTWGVGPYLDLSYFDPETPVRADLGLALSAQYELAPGLELSGVIKKKVVGNIDGTSASDSVLPHVRSDAGRYASEGDPSLEQLTLAYYARPGRNLYSRVTAGYLEPMFAGISGEVLWKPVDSAFALGAEMNYVWQRDYNQQFGLQDYDVATGHVSAYYRFARGFDAQLDLGRYLAGDWGGTVSIDRTFKNGWSIGAYATLTDVSFDDYGEGSFDKGLRFTIPLESLFGSPTRQKNVMTVRSLARDGGARLQVEGRLYDTVRGNDQISLSESWGKFWK